MAVVAKVLLVFLLWVRLVSRRGSVRIRTFDELAKCSLPGEPT